MSRPASCAGRSVTAGLPNLLPPDLLTITGPRQLTQALSTPAAERHLAPAAIDRLLARISRELVIEVSGHVEGA